MGISPQTVSFNNASGADYVDTTPFHQHNSDYERNYWEAFNHKEVDDFYALQRHDEEVNEWWKQRSLKESKEDEAFAETYVKNYHAEFYGCDVRNAEEINLERWRSGISALLRQSEKVISQETAEEDLINKEWQARLIAEYKADAKFAAECIFAK